MAVFLICLARVVEYIRTSNMRSPVTASNSLGRQTRLCHAGHRCRSRAVHGTRLVCCRSLDSARLLPVIGLSSSVAGHRTQLLWLHLGVVPFSSMWLGFLATGLSAPIGLSSGLSGPAGANLRQPGCWPPAGDGVVADYRSMVKGRN